MRSLPSNWECVKLENLLIGKPCNGLYKAGDFIGRGTLFLDINGLYKGLIADFSKARRVELLESEYKQYELVKGDILFNRVSKMPEGVGKAVVVNELKEPAVYESNMIRVRLDKERVDPLFIVQYLSTDRSRKELLAKANIANQASINQQAIKSLEIPLPPIAEQKRIAAILDKAEELRGLRRKTLGELDAIAQSIFLEMFGDPGVNPKGWDKGFLGDIATFVGGGTPKRERPEYFEGSICWATSKDMKHEFLDDTQEHITRQAIEESATNLVPIGTILIVVKSKILAHSLPVAISRVPTCFGQDIKGIRISERCAVSFIATTLRYGKKWLLERARGINTEGLTLDHLRSFPLMLPPLPLQQEFARRVEAIEHLKATHRESLDHLNALFASLQHRAFRGEL